MDIVIESPAILAAIGNQTQWGAVIEHIQGYDQYVSRPEIWKIEQPSHLTLLEAEWPGSGAVDSKKGKKSGLD
jgi:hypothetical protein